MSLLDHPVISSRYFFPRASTPSAKNRVDVEVDGATLACAQWDFGAERTLVHFHGNGEVVADWEGVFPTMAERMGVNLFLAEYRGYGGSSGTPMLGAMLDDVEAIAEAAGDNLVVFGRSVGSIYAIELADRCEVHGLVLESGIADVLQRILLRAEPHEFGVDRATIEAEFDERVNHSKKLARYDGPLLILHAVHDHLVGVQHAHDNASDAAGDVTKHLFETGDHNSIFARNQSEYEAVLTGWLSSLESSMT